LFLSLRRSFRTEGSSAAQLRRGFAWLVSPGAKYNLPHNISCKICQYLKRIFTLARYYFSFSGFSLLVIPCLLCNSAALRLGDQRPGSDPCRKPDHLAMSLATPILREGKKRLPSAPATPCKTMHNRIHLDRSHAKTGRKRANSWKSVRKRVEAARGRVELERYVRIPWIGRPPCAISTGRPVASGTRSSGSMPRHW